MRACACVRASVCLRPCACVGHWEGSEGSEVAAGEGGVHLPDGVGSQVTRHQGEVKPPPSGVGGLPSVEKADVRDILEQHSQVAARLIGWGWRLQHWVVGIEVSCHLDTGLGGKAEQLPSLQLVSLAPVYVVHQEQEASHLQL
ncbi:hypothetical protein Pcinc_003780 [Petrolisthes cinctipes]|uniref:Uncharacterized protein n=1 Tax=Petrolisthes cinctipes TaxID=88211 RepID=A0AAE1L286_PETCI|nr:hypothetical protein Pcinc_003780 [Petrolisthes cinctipes]